MNHIRKAYAFFTLLTAAVCIAAIGSLAACNLEGESSKAEPEAKPGSIKLTLDFPAFTGEETITKLSATLEKADGTGTPETLEIEGTAFSRNSGANTITLSFGSVPPDQYILILRFYRGETVAAVCIEGVTVRPGEESNKWQAGDGGTYSTRTFRQEEFRSMAVAASFILKNSDASIVPLNMTDPMPLNWQLDKDSVKNNGEGMQLEISLYGGAGTSLLAVTLNNVDKRGLFTLSNGSSSVPVYTGVFDIGTGETLISVEVQAPDRATTVCYTISQSRAVTVTFDADGGEPASVQFRCIKGETLETLPANPSKDGYIFGGWFTEQNGGGTQFTASTLVNANMTVYAKWTYQVTFDADGGTPATSTASCLAGATVGLPSPEPTKASHLFGGWFTEPNGGGTPFTAATLVTANMTVYAKWIRVEDAVTVTFDAAGGTPGTSTVNCAHGESVGLPSPDPTHAYHTFGGWYTEPYGNGTEFTATTPVTANITVYAKWTPYPQVTFDAGTGGTPAISTVLYPPGAMVNLPSEPTYPDHAFGGWYTEPNGNGMPFGTSIPVTEDMTVYAKWTPYLHVTFDADGGTPAISTASCPAGATVGLPSNPTRADYIFRGWYPEPNGGGTEFTATTLVTADMRVYAKWTYPQVTFDANGGTPATSTASCLAGATVGLPSDPTRTDYYFDGWYTAPNGGGTQFTAATPVNADTTVYAKWIREAEAVTVTFDANGGTPATSTVSCPAGARVNLPSDPTHTYHTFGGWYTEPNGNGTEFTATTLVTTNTTVYAKWTPYLQVTFDANGGTPAISTALCPAGVRVNLPSDPIYTEHTFGGWYTAPNGLGTQFTAATRVTANMTVYAKWTPYLQVTFDADGGTFANGETTSTASCPAGTTVVTVAMVALPSNPTRAGYAIDGWYTEPNGNGTQITATTLVNAGMTVYANWKPYLQVTFDTDGGEPITMTMTCLSGEYAGLPGNPTKAGHTFDGWYTEQNGNGTQFTAATRVNANMTVYAKWTPYLQVTFNADGGIFYEMAGFPATSTASCPAGTTVVLPSLNPTRASYDFFGWYTEQNGGGTQFTASTPVTEDMTVYAKWTPWPVVTFYAEGGEPETSTASCPAGTTVGVLPNSDRDGWSVGGWYTEPDGGGTEFTTSTPVTEDMTVYPTWVK